MALFNKRVCEVTVCVGTVWVFLSGVIRRFYPSYFSQKKDQTPLPPPIRTNRSSDSLSSLFSLSLSLWRKTMDVVDTGETHGSRLKHETSPKEWQPTTSYTSSSQHSARTQSTPWRSPPIARTGSPGGSAVSNSRTQNLGPRPTSSPWASSPTPSLTVHLPTFFLFCFLSFGCDGCLCWFGDDLRMDFESDIMGLEREMNDLRMDFESERMGLEREMMRF